ncbi:MAG TPA: amidohydrolase family protein [Methylomirabilota bacterium]|nr:amidohydrolase family protein [Methylomirabilota bacterium]
MAQPGDSSRPKLFTDAKLAFPDFFASGELLVINGRIETIWIEEQASFVPPDAEIIDCGGAILAPGLVDIHNNGALGHEFVAGDPEGNNRALAWHLQQGVTSVVATIMTAPQEEMARAVRVLSDQAEQGALQPNFSGIHIEGPYFHPDKRGAHRLECLREPRESEYRELFDAARGTLRLFTFAPEISGAVGLCAFLHERGVTPTIGHTTASFAQIRRAVAAGARHMVHANNAVDWPTRRPNNTGWLGTELMPMGALLADYRLTCEIIADGYHVPWPLVQALVKAKGAENVALVSDASSACGCPPGQYSLAGMQVEVRPERLIVATGAPVQGVPPLAGSGSSLLWMVQNAAEWGCSLLTALKMATRVPARIAGLRRKGELLVGNDADLILLGGAGELRAVYSGCRRI